MDFSFTILAIGFPFILVIISIKSGGSVSQQNVSTVIVPENKNEVTTEQNPYQLAYNKCTHPKMAEFYQNKCIEWELKKSGVKN